MLSVKDLGKIYKTGEKSLAVLENISFEVTPGESVAIIGPSGSGKTTLLGLCAGLDKASSGSIILNGEALSRLDEDQRAEVRNKYVGFIFQNFRLLPTLTALENVAVPLELRGNAEASLRAQELLDRVGLGDRTHHYPSQLSGGEQQRVALARAFSNKPLILFADEPTGNLDDATSEKVEQLLFELNREAGTTLILVTHDMELASKTERIIKLRGGKIIEELIPSAGTL
ncbi:MAG: ABC transporter ATP-binding protein [Bacteroidota bacterium]